MGEDKGEPSLAEQVARLDSSQAPKRKSIRSTLEHKLFVTELLRYITKEFRKVDQLVELFQSVDDGIKYVMFLQECKTVIISLELTLRIYNIYEILCQM